MNNFRLYDLGQAALLKSKLTFRHILSGNTSYITKNKLTKFKFIKRYFTPHIFFVIILPPIVFDAGFFMPKARGTLTSVPV